MHTTPAITRTRFAPEQAASGARKRLARPKRDSPCYHWYERGALPDPVRGEREFQGFMGGLRKSWEAARERHAR